MASPRIIGTPREYQVATLDIEGIQELGEEESGVVYVLNCQERDNITHSHDSSESSSESEDELFEFIPPEQEPKFQPVLKKKTENAIKVVAKLSFTPTLVVSKQPSEKLERTSKLSCFPSRKTRDRKSKKQSAAKFSARLKRASSQGFQIMKNILFPSIPAVFQDIWVYIEMVIAITAFIIGALDTFRSSSISIFTIIYFSLAVVSFALVISDGYLYFIELGSCARGYRFFLTKWKEKREQEKTYDVELEEKARKYCKLSPKWKQYFNTWFEVIRNTVTELLLYPLLIFDLLSFIVERGYKPSNTMQQADFTLFILESFYLILSVYIMRMILVITSMISLIKLSVDKNDDTTKPILVRFSAHMIGQIFVHLFVVLAVAAKINNENPVTTNMNNVTNDLHMDDDGDINVSYFLIIAIITGGIVPLAGSGMFFIVNFYWMRQFSVTFWVNMISLLQGESFAEAVFGGEGVSSKDKAREFVQNSQFSKIKKELKKYKSPTLFSKLCFPARVPGLIAVCLLFNALLITFIVSLMVTEFEGYVTLAIFREDYLLSAMFTGTTLCLIIANIHILVLINTLIVIVTLLIVSCTVLTILGIFLSITFIFPALGGVGFSLLLIDICSPLFACRPHNKSTEYSSSNKLVTQDETTDTIEEHDYQEFAISETTL